MNQEHTNLGPAMWPVALNGMAAAFCCWLLLDWRLQTGPAFWIWIIVLGGLVFRISMVIYVFAGLSLVWPLVMDRRAGFFRGSSVEAVDILFVVVWMGFIYFCFRFMDELSEFRAQSFARKIGQGSTRNPLADHRQTGLPGAWWIPVAVAIGLVLLLIVPENPDSRRLFRLTEGGLRTITFVWMLGVVWLVLQTGFGLAGWYRMRPDAARMYIRNCLAQEVRSEMAGIERRRQRMMQSSRQLRKRRMGK